MRSGVVLAGGRSSRMGIEKGLILMGDKPLISKVIDSLSPLVDELIVSVSESPTDELLELVNSNATIVKDEIPGMGPIGGLLFSFKAASGEYTAVAPCDSPFIKPELYELLFEKANGSDGAVPVINGYYEPLQAVYRRDVFIDALQTVISSRKSKPVDAYEQLDLEFVKEQYIRDVDPGLESFLNINTIGDYKRLQEKDHR